MAAVAVCGPGHSRGSWEFVSAMGARSHMLGLSSAVFLKQTARSWIKSGSAKTRTVPMQQLKPLCHNTGLYLNFVVRDSLCISLMGIEFNKNACGLSLGGAWLCDRCNEASSLAVPLGSP